MPLWMCGLIGVLSALLDASGIGPNRYRDRVAAVGYLASALGWFDQLGISAWEVRVLKGLSHDWRIFWSMVGVAPVAMWICAMVPPFVWLGALGKVNFRSGRLADRVASARAGAPAAGGAGQERINTYLLTVTVAVAASVPLAMPSAWQDLVHWITATVTAAALVAGHFIASRFGWK